MTEQTEADKTSNPRRKDVRFWVVMLAIYIVCCVAFVSGSFIWIREDRKAAGANATSTQIMLVTEQANVTATAAARLIDQDTYTYIERFDKITGDWFVGSNGKKYGDMRMIIKDGVYIWNVADSKGFTLGTDFYKGNKLKNFDVYVDTKFINDEIQGSACSGFFFRKPDADWNNGAYTFVVCDDSRVEVYYFSESRWQNIAFLEYEPSIQPADWNRIEISARDNHFVFTINNVPVYEMMDDRLKEGSLGLFVDVDPGVAAEVWFDNFGYQNR